MNNACDRSSSKKGKTGVLLVNVGTPKSPAPRDVRKYLAEFLFDPRVISIPAIPRFLLLHCLILPFRARQSAKLYRSIWTTAGSPLLANSTAFGNRLAEALAEDFSVRVCMRYGEPSINAEIQSLLKQGIQKLIVFPLFPQYSSAATGSACEAAMRSVSAAWNIPEVRILPPFYNHPQFIESVARVSRQQLDEFSPDFVLFSYHGLPEDHIRRSDVSQGGFCLSRDHCCDRICHENHYCYKAQCYTTSRLLAEALQIKKENLATAFQSRLGRRPWIKPYTDHLLPQLITKGVRRLAVLCPSFVADCLETLEEIGVRAREQWLELGGEDLKLVTALNDDSQWAEAVAQWIKQENRIPT